MAVSGTEEQLPAELLQRWASYIESDRLDSFWQACKQSNIQTIESSLKPFFTTWTTSLMGSDIDKLRSFCKEKHLRGLVETLIIQDSCESLDPWNFSEMSEFRTDLSSCKIWRRDENGLVPSQELGTTDLSLILREKFLRPRTIIVRDYQIYPLNYQLCPEMNGVKDLIEGTRSAANNSVAVSILTRDIIECSHLSITSLVIQYRLQHSHPTNGSILRQLEGFHTIAPPRIYEAIISLSSEHQGQENGLPRLQMADLSLAHQGASYWLRQIFYRAPALKTFKLTSRELGNLSLTATRVVPKLNELYLLHTRISAELLKDMLVSSRETLTNIDFFQVILDKESAWRELLLHIAKEFPALNAFTLKVLGYGGKVFDFQDLKDKPVPEQYRSGLQLIQLRPDIVPVTRLSYTGTNAGEALSFVAMAMKY